MSEKNNLLKINPRATLISRSQNEESPFQGYKELETSLPITSWNNFIGFKPALSYGLSGNVGNGKFNLNTGTSLYNPGISNEGRYFSASVNPSLNFKGKNLSGNIHGGVSLTFGTKYPATTYNVGTSIQKTNSPIHANLDYSRTTYDEGKEDSVSLGFGNKKFDIYGGVTTGTRSRYNPLKINLSIDNLTGSLIPSRLELNLNYDKPYVDTSMSRRTFGLNGTAGFNWRPNSNLTVSGKFKSSGLLKYGSGTNYTPIGQIGINYRFKNGGLINKFADGGSSSTSRSSWDKLDDETKKRVGVIYKTAKECGLDSRNAAMLAQWSVGENGADPTKLEIGSDKTGVGAFSTTSNTHIPFIKDYAELAGIDLNNIDENKYPGLKDILSGKNTNPNRFKVTQKYILENMNDLALQTKAFIKSHLRYNPNIKSSNKLNFWDAAEDYWVGSPMVGVGLKTPSAVGSYYYKFYNKYPKRYKTYLSNFLNWAKSQNEDASNPMSTYKYMLLLHLDEDTNNAIIRAFDNLLSNISFDNSLLKSNNTPYYKSMPLDGKSGPSYVSNSSHRLMKKGGKLKVQIKKSNEGKFTDYCGGEVTDECITRAKASGNPKLVKRATFAANARKWKH